MHYSSNVKHTGLQTVSKYLGHAKLHTNYMCAYKIDLNTNSIQLHGSTTHLHKMDTHKSKTTLHMTQVTED